MVTRPIRNVKNGSPPISYQPHRCGLLSECIHCYTERRGIDHTNMWLRSKRHQAKKCSCRCFRKVWRCGNCMQDLLDRGIGTSGGSENAIHATTTRVCHNRWLAKFTAYQCDAKPRAERTYSNQHSSQGTVNNVYEHTWFYLWSHPRGTLDQEKKTFTS